MKKTGAYPASDARDADTLAKVRSSGGKVEEKSILVHESLRGAAGVRTAGGPTPATEVTLDPNEEIDNDVLRQYEFNQLVGRGTYGVVWKARSKASRKHVAFKKLFHCWRNQTDAQRAYREIMYLHAFNGHDNAAKLRKVMKSNDTKHIYMVFEYITIEQL